MQNKNPGEPFVDKPDACCVSNITGVQGQFSSTRPDMKPPDESTGDPLRQLSLRFLACWLFVLLGVVIGSDCLAESRFTDNGDGTVTDHQLGLMWAKFDNQGDIDWKQAQAWARHNFDYTVNKQYADWRLPTVEELKSLYNSSQTYTGYTTDCGVAVRIVPEIVLSCALVWSSDVALGSHLAFNFIMGDAFTVSSYEITGCRALPVRSLK